jgi:4-diphosphocytidyl-2-C-methyl-D-erythritol kinase
MKIDRLEPTPSSSGLRCQVPCKINLFLEVLGKRPDGYHDLDTVMLGVDLCDELTLRAQPQPSIELTLEESSAILHDAFATSIPTDDRNLVVRALKKLQASLGIQQGAQVTLTKRIPVQAGLGGGSADAAAALVIGSLAWTGQLHMPVLQDLAKELGSDLNFFLEGWREGHWTARCLGRGERVEPVSNPQRQYVVIAQPPEGCDTASIFRVLARWNTESANASESVLRNSDELLERLALGQSDHVGRLLYNRLELAARECNSWIDRTARRFDRYNPLGHCLSGSGSARFCLCSTRLEAEKIASELASLNEFRVFMASTWHSPSIQEQAKQLGFGT